MILWGGTDHLVDPDLDPDVSRFRPHRRDHGVPPAPLPHPPRRKVSDGTDVVSLCPSRLPPGPLSKLHPK